MTKEEKLKYHKDIGDRLLEDRYRYYELDDNVITDAEYDRREKMYELISTELNIEPTATNMVGWDITKPGALEAKNRVDNGEDHHQLWINEMMPIWDRLGPPKVYKDLYTKEKHKKGK